MAQTGHRHRMSGRASQVHCLAANDPFPTATPPSMICDFRAPLAKSVFSGGIRVEYAAVICTGVCD